MKCFAFAKSNFSPGKKNNGEGSCMIWKEVRHAVGACTSEEGAEAPPLSLLAGWTSALRQDLETTTSQIEYLCK